MTSEADRKREREHDGLAWNLWRFCPYILILLDQKFVWIREIEICCSIERKKWWLLPCYKWSHICHWKLRRYSFCHSYYYHYDQRSTTNTIAIIRILVVYQYVLVCWCMLSFHLLFNSHNSSDSDWHHHQRAWKGVM